MTALPEAVVELGPLGQVQTVVVVEAQEESSLVEAVEEGVMSVPLLDRLCRTS